MAALPGKKERENASIYPNIWGTPGYSGGGGSETTHGQAGSQALSPMRAGGKGEMAFLPIHDKQKGPKHHEAMAGGQTQLGKPVCFISSSCQVPFIFPFFSSVGLG